MKRVCVYLLILGLCATAKSEVNISIVDPYITTNESASISLWGDGQTLPGDFFIGVNKNTPGSLNFDHARFIYPGNSTYICWYDDSTLADELGFKNPIIAIGLNDIPLPGTDQDWLIGQLVDNITFRSNTTCIATISLIDLASGGFMDSQTITIVPEPTTIFLFGLGGLLLRRRK